MPAMHDIVFHGMETRLAEKRDIMLRTLSFEMTHDECMQLVAPSDHINILTKAAKFANVKSSEDWIELAVPAVIDGDNDVKVLLCMRTHAEKQPPLMPRNPQWQPGQAGHKVIAWLTKRYEIGRRFGAARHVLYMLNRECDNGHQMRDMWPAVMHLCGSGMSDRMDRWMEKYSAYKPCKHTPAVSREMKIAIQDSSALLTSMALIGEDVPEPAIGFVNISEYSLGTFTLDGGITSRM